MAGSKWTDDETIALIDAYGEQIIQDAVDGMATNRVVYCEPATENHERTVERRQNTDTNRNENEEVKIRLYQAERSYELAIR